MSLIFERDYKFKISEKLNFESYCNLLHYDESGEERANIRNICNQYSDVYMANRTNSLLYCFIFGYLKVLSKNEQNDGT